MLLSIVLAVYLGAALFVTEMMSAAEPAGGMTVAVEDTGSGFVTAEGVRAELKSGDKDLTAVGGRLLKNINLQAIEDRLMEVDNIETATVYRTFKKDGSKIVVEVTPMKPVLRIFDPSTPGKSYYVNHAGKRLTANHRFHKDVPVIIGQFDTNDKLNRVMPLIDYMTNDRNLSAFVSSMEMTPNNDIILYPAHTGPVINFGDASMIKNKLKRIMRFYQDVIKVKGYEYYDTISVKWNGQLVATRHKKTRRDDHILPDTDIDADNIDLGYMDTVPLTRQPVEPTQTR
ncbi:MAG: cell division protein FtsQ/DivIB [Muribaculaceae bacterium]|nr:cell division protein FtsQ/DivIB [Muribaculaceae bacterium]